MLYLLMKLLMTVKTEAIKLRHTHTHTLWTRNYFLSSKKLFLRLQPRLSYFPLTLISALSLLYQELITTCMEFCSKHSSQNFPNNGSNYSELWNQTIRIVSFGCCYRTLLLNKLFWRTLSTIIEPSNFFCNAKSNGIWQIPLPLYSDRSNVPYVPIKGCTFELNIFW